MEAASYYREWWREHRWRIRLVDLGTLALSVAAPFVWPHSRELIIFGAVLAVPGLILYHVLFPLWARQAARAEERNRPLRDPVNSVEERAGMT